MGKKEKKIKAPETSFVLTVILGLAMACAITCAVFIGYALILTYTNITEAHLPLIVIATTIVSALVAGFDTSKAVDKKGWLWGMLAGLLYVLIIFAVGAVFSSGFALGSNLFVLAVISTAGGGVGGIIGINFKK